MVKYSYYDSKIGVIKIGISDGAICEIEITDCLDESAPSALADRVFKEISEYLNGKRKAFDFPIAPKGTDFQKKVWTVLRKIPYGETKTYGEIAAYIGNPRAARAVGNACNKNPLLLAVPCHRVLGADGSLTGFAAGIEIKKHLLLLEKKCDF
ncbi:MAG: methylated-DNA--[protein]-cysteine S-methyltransferase [Acutalibacteraceae bacterium]